MQWLKILKRIPLIYIFLSGIIFSCTAPEANEDGLLGPFEWNYLIYMAADNNLERFAIDNLIDMKKVGSNDKVNILVLLDRSPGYDKRYGNWSDTRLLRITRDTDFTSIDNDLVVSYGELDMTNPDNLENFLLYANKNYEAEKTALVLWSHGTGIYPEGIFTDETPSEPSKLSVLSKAVVHDYSTGYDYSDAIFMQDMEKILHSIYVQTGNKLDILQFDTCLMQMNEVVWQLADVVDMFAGSEPDMPGQGTDYAEILQYITDNDKTSAKDLASHLASVYYEKYNDSILATGYSAFSAKDVWPEYKSLFSDWVVALLDADSEEIIALRQIREQMLVYQKDYPEYADLLYYLKAIEGNEQILSPLKTATQSMKAILEKGMLAHKATHEFYENLYGIGINFPYTKKQFDRYTENVKPSSTERLKFLQDTRWQEFIVKIIEANADS